MKIIKSEQIGNFIFAQLHPFHQDFFHGSGRILLRDTPHYQILRDGSIYQDENKYTNYLEHSWKFYKPEDNTPKSRMENNANYRVLLENIKKNGYDKRNPIEICETLDGATLIIDGNHRASCAYFLGLDIPVIKTPLEKYLQKQISFSNNTEQYAAKNNIPYQSVFCGDKCLIKGRRLDILERFKKIALEDIRGKDVLDLGCNIAISAHLAWHYGANQVIGCEYSLNIARTALRIGTAFNSKVRLMVQDLGHPLALSTKFDTIFAFSIYFHVKNKEEFVRNILNNLAENGCIYFEGHEGSSDKDYELLLNHFQKIDFLGYNAAGIHDKRYNRPFWKLSSIKPVN